MMTKKWWFFKFEQKLMIFSNFGQKWWFLKKLGKIDDFSNFGLCKFNIWNMNVILEFRNSPEWWSTSFKAPSSNFEQSFRHNKTSNSSFRAFLNITWLALDPNWLRLPVMLVWANCIAFNASSKWVTPSFGSPIERKGI